MTYAPRFALRCLFALGTTLRAHMRASYELITDEPEVITLGEMGALFHSRERSIHIPAFDAGPVVETTGAGDAFNGGFATGLARGMSPAEAVRFGCAVAGISVTRAGTAPSMPRLGEVEALLARG